MDKRFLSYEQAVSLLPEGEYIHTFTSGGMLIGADWSRAEILEKLKKSDAIELTGEMARSMGHGMCAYNLKDGRVSNLLFIETEAAKLAKIDEECENEPKAN